MSTRKGNVVYLEEVLTEAAAKSLDIILQRSPNLKNKEKTAQAIGVGAVKFSVLKNARTKDSVFSLDKVLSFEGETSCYIQYTHARIGSVLRKAGRTDLSDAEVDYSILTDDVSFEAVKLLSMFRRRFMRRRKNMNRQYLQSICSSWSKHSISFIMTARYCPSKGIYARQGSVCVKL
jgi:arginyl-tRNA synthetase